MNEMVVPVEVYSRCVGYFRPVSGWNPGKKAEFKERNTIKEYGVRKVVDDEGKN